MDKINYARKLCRENGVKYMIKCKHTNALYIYCPYTGHYMFVCYELLNLDYDYIKSMIEKHIENYC